MNPLQQRIERKPASLRNGDLAVEHEVSRLELRQCSGHFGAVTRERLQRLRLKLHLGTIAKRNAPKAVPLRLVLPLLSLRSDVHRQGFHGGKRRADFARHTHSNGSPPEYPPDEKGVMSQQDLQSTEK